MLELFYTDLVKPFQFIPDSQIKMNLYENQDEYLMCLELSGLNKNSIDVNIYNNKINISGDRICGSTNYSIIHQGIRDLKFKKSYTLSENMDPDNISADYENGILKIKIGKKSGSKFTKKIEIH